MTPLPARLALTFAWSRTSSPSVVRLLPTGQLECFVPAATERDMDVRRLGGCIVAALRALTVGGSLPIPSWIANGLAIISLVLSSCDLLHLCSDRDHC
uniref:Uncharacterized protein n=1 Tax=Sorghum bicolor TaxID=4558 RepID=C6JRN9_SORBI